MSKKKIVRNPCVSISDLPSEDDFSHCTYLSEANMVSIGLDWEVIEDDDAEPPPESPLRKYVRECSWEEWLLFCVFFVQFYVCLSFIVIITIKSHINGTLLTSTDTFKNVTDIFNVTDSDTFNETSTVDNEEPNC